MRYQALISIGQSFDHEIGVGSDTDAQEDANISVVIQLFPGDGIPHCTLDTGHGTSTTSELYHNTSLTSVTIPRPIL